MQFVVPTWENASTEAPQGYYLIFPTEPPIPPAWLPAPPPMGGWPAEQPGSIPSNPFQQEELLVNPSDVGVMPEVATQDTIDLTQSPERAQSPVIESLVNPETNLVNEETPVEKSVRIQEEVLPARSVGIQVSVPEEPEWAPEPEPAAVNTGGLVFTGERLYCDTCPFHTDNQLRFSYHLMAHAAHICYSCNLCPYISLHMNSLKYHVESHHSEVPFSPDTYNKVINEDSQVPIPPEEISDSVEKLYTCFICYKGFTKRSRLARHMDVHSDQKQFPCCLCKKAFNQKVNLDAHMRVHNGRKPFPCGVCEKSFSHKCNLKAHMRSHSGVKPYSCDICYKKFNQQSNLKTHMRSHPSHESNGTRTFPCDMCKKVFSAKGNLRRHQNTTHFNEKPFTCDICKQSFQQKTHLIFHIQAHSGEKSFSCHICDKSFVQKANYDRHIAMHDGVRPYTCRICKVAFTLNAALKSHVRSAHTCVKPYACDVCHRRFYHRRNVRLHKKTHDVRGPVWCDICNKEFKYESKLKRHFKLVCKYPPDYD